MIRAVLTDIEGTTTRLSLVREVLFPYARARFAEHVRVHRAEPEIAAILDQVRVLALEDTMSEEAILTTLQRWSDEDRKATPLKTLQGIIWAEGYRRGDLRGHVYDDVVPSLEAWRTRGLAIHVYSSGSIAAQKLLFGHTERGDLTPLFAGFFDTTTGPKLAKESYLAIAAAIGVAPGEILFLSDHAGELDAARAAGLATTWLERDPGTTPAAGHPRAATFADVRID